MATIPGLSDDYNLLRVYDWGDPLTILPIYSGKKGSSFASIAGGVFDLTVQHESDPTANSLVGNEFRHYLNPRVPTPYPAWGDKEFHYRSEYNIRPWNVDHPLGTEEWFGWSVRFPSTYHNITNGFMNIMQLKTGTTDQSPAIKLMLTGSSDPNANGIKGELMIANYANDTGGDKYHPLGVAPQPSETWQFVVHVVHDRSPDGSVKFWATKNSTLDKVDDLLFDQPNVHTVYSDNIGGNLKIGAYVSLWKHIAGVELLEAEGMTELILFTGTLRIMSRKTSTSGYGDDEFDLVKPTLNVDPPSEGPGSVELFKKNINKIRI